MPAPVAGTFDFAGIEDLYFAAAFMPPFTAHGDLAQVPLALTGWTFQHQTTGSDGKVVTDAIPEVAAGITSAGPVDLRVYVGPKSIDGLKAIRPPLNSIVQFGIWGFIAEPLFYGLRWLYRYAPNYGLGHCADHHRDQYGDVPAQVKSMRAMLKMQRVAPEIKAIQERYKKYSMRDPRKAEMNKEVMAVYSRESINPLGSCWPTLIQMPIWLGLYRMLTYTIELRTRGMDRVDSRPFGARSLLHFADRDGDLNVFHAEDDAHPGMDPAQARMMGFTPLIFGGMFAFSASGLALYIFTSNLIGIGQRGICTGQTRRLRSRRGDPGRRK